MTKKAIIHVENTENLAEFARYLVSSDWSILSANKTLDFLEKENIPVTKESALVENNQYTLETCQLIQKILETKTSEEGEPEEELDNIYLVCMNVYPKYDAINSEQELNKVCKPVNYYHTTVIKNAVYNYQNVLVITDPDDYKEVMIQLRIGSIKPEFRVYLAGKALNLLAAYENSLAFSILNGKYFNQPFMKYFGAPYVKDMDLKYGTNKQQKASVYSLISKNENYQIQKIQGKEFTYNVIEDLSFAWEQISILFTQLRDQMVVKSKNCDGYEFTTHFTPLLGTVFTVVVKNKIILGAALSSNVLDSFEKTMVYDVGNIRGTVLACSAVIDEDAAKEMVKNDFEAIIAPGFTTEAKQILSGNRNIRLIPSAQIRTENIDVRLVLGGLLIQTKENVLFEKWDVRTKNRPSQSQIDQMAFGMMIAMNSKSCSAVLVKNNSVVGLSQSCVSALKAIKNVYVDAKEMQDRLGKNNDSLAEVLISDSPIPFCDDVKNIIDGGVGAIIQPGGTVYDDEFVQYCNDRGVVMIFIGMSHILR